MLRIGLLTSGGDCQALNATMRGIVKTLYNKSKETVEIYGFEDGYQGMIYGRYRKMTSHDFSGILTRGGTILGTSRTPFKRIDTPEADGVEKVPAMIKTYKQLHLDCLFALGGNGSLKTANRLSQEGLNVIGLPKTIDNDTWGTEMTFGFTRSWVTRWAGFRCMRALPAAPTSSSSPRSPTAWITSSRPSRSA